jgi:hypothetical protein
LGRLSNVSLLFAALIGACSGTPVLAASPMAVKQFPARMLAAHNRLRAASGAPALQWDAALGNAAARFAFELALTNSFHHSSPGARKGAGENLWMGTRGAFSYEQMVDAWTSEQRDFVPGVFPSVSRSGKWEDVGHYTQMVWPTTTRVGCALASNAANDFLVCRYSPAGNVLGRAVPYATVMAKGSSAFR